MSIGCRGPFDPDRKSRRFLGVWWDVIRNYYIFTSRIFFTLKTETRNSTRAAKSTRHRTEENLSICSLNFLNGGTILFYHAKWIMMLFKGWFKPFYIINYLYRLILFVVCKLLTMVFGFFFNFEGKKTNKSW